MTHFPALPLQSERLTLRPYRADDAEAVFTIFSDPRVMRFWSTPPWTSTAQAHEAIDSDLQALHSGRHLRLGFRLEGRLRERWIVGGEVSDSAIYGLLRREWALRHTPR